MIFFSAATAAPATPDQFTNRLLEHAQLESIRMLTSYDMDSVSPFACALSVGQPTLRTRP